MPKISMLFLKLFAAAYSKTALPKPPFLTPSSIVIICSKVENMCFNVLMSSGLIKLKL